MKVVDWCSRCGGELIEREKATIVTVACSRKGCPVFYTKPKKMKKPARP